MKIVTGGLADSSRFWRIALSAGASSLAMALAFPAAAQDEADEDEVVEIDEDDSVLDDINTNDTIVVTGSRIARKEFTGASPVQVIQGQIARESGLLSLDEILQTTPQSTGLQIDQTFGGFVLDNGPGATQVSFRGLDPERTLVLVNGRRMSPAGVGGAPTTPDLSLIPTILIDRIDNLFDGASSVYGSDAIAGVANVILRDDFDGFQLDLDTSIPFQGGGEEYTVSAAWGTTGDNGYVGFGVEYQKTNATRFRDRDFFGRCESHIQETESGDILNIETNRNPGVTRDECQLFPLTNRIFIPLGFGSVYRTPGETNIGIPNYSETQLGAQFDFDGDGLQDVDFKDPFYAYDSSDRARSGHILPDNQTLSFYAYGEYDTGKWGNVTPFFEALYSNRQTDIFSGGGAQFFPTVPSDNPFNPCNNTINDNGTPGDASDDYANNPEGVNCLGEVFGVDLGSFDVDPIVNIRGDRDTTEIDISLYRLVGGARGELPFMNEVESFSDWTWEASASYSRSVGFSRFQGIHEQRLNLSLETSVRNPDGTVTCGGDVTQTIDCVPVNLFAPGIFRTGGGNLTPAEGEFLFVNADFTTIVEQTVIQGFAGGNLFQLPWNGTDVPILLGYEYRRDSIDSRPSDVVENGLIAFRASDRGAAGARALHEFFFETRIDVLTDRPGVDLFQIEAAGRYTDESNFGSEFTYSGKALYRPVDFLTLRGTYGTSFRAPNTREQFLLGGTGFLTLSDPCVVPDSARVAGATPTDPATYSNDGVTGVDNRDAFTISQCQAQGVDPFSLGITTVPPSGVNFSTEILTGGNETLQAETSRSFTGGIVFEQPFTDAFGLTASATYYNIRVNDSVEEPSTASILNFCYFEESDATGPFCDRITRDSDGFFELVDTSFINIGELTAKGIDYNLLVTKEFEAAGRDFDLSLDVRASQLLEQSVDILGAIDDNAGEIASPTWRGTANFIASSGDWRLNWFTRLIGAGTVDEPDDFDFGFETCPEPNPVTRPDAPGVTCRPVASTGTYIVNNMSITYAPDTWVISAGISNIFARDPELVDPSGAFSVNNLPLGVGYDIDGRTFFASIRKSF